MAHLIGDLAAGGAQRQLVHLLAALDGRGPPHDVITWRPGAERHALREQLPEAVHQWHFPKHQRTDPVWLARVVSHLRQVRPDILHCWLNPASWWGAMLAPAAGVKNLITSEMVARLPPRRRLVHRLAAAVVADSRAVFEVLPARKRVFVPVGIPPAEPGESADLAGRVVLCVASLQPDKNQRALIDLARATDDHVVLVGRDEDAGYGAQLRRDAPANVTFAGEVADVAPFYRRADVFVLPSRTESSPNALLEAMSHGCPVVASDVGDIRELLDGGRLGRLVAPGDQSALERGVAQPNAGDAGPDWVQLKYNVAQMADQYRALYDRIAG